MEPPGETEIAVTAAGAGGRMDVFLSHELGVPRAVAARLIREGRVLLSGSAGRAGPLKPSRQAAPGEVFSVRMPPPETLEIEPEDVPFDVVHEDPYLLVIDKPAGLVVHPAPGHWRGTLVHGLLWRYPDLGPFNNVRRPGIVHRLDAGTSGLMLAAREQRTMELLQKDFKERAIEKFYLSLARGGFRRREGVLEGPIGRHPSDRLKMAVVEGGRPAATEYRILWERGGYSFVVCKLLTGRTHQIRVHLAAAGHPLAGDPLYGERTEKSDLRRVFLHSWKLAFTHPVTGQRLSFTRPLPKELRAFLKTLGAPP
jgi:23S rRNA pseudouridine1911/1915/1917 synthase